MRTLTEGLLQQAKTIKSGITLPTYTSNNLIHLYAKHNLLQHARKLFDQIPHPNTFSYNAIISAYIKSRNLPQAKSLFHAAPNKDLVTYNSLLAGYVTSLGHENDALNLFLEMHNRHFTLDEFTLTTMVGFAGKVRDDQFGRVLHCYMVKTGNSGSGFALCSLLDMYSKCRSFWDARAVFEVGDLRVKNAMVAACCRAGELEMGLEVFESEAEEKNDVVSWNTLVSGYVGNGFVKEGLEVFVRMAESGVRWNEYTFATVLSACASLRSLRLGKEVHCWVLKNGMMRNAYISCGVVDVYCKCGDMKYAEAFYSRYGERNLFAVSSMIVGYSVRGDMVQARKLFDSLECRNSVVWTALFSGYVRSEQCEAVFELLREFRAKEAVTPDGLIFLNVLGACALQAAVDPGKQVHAYMLRVGIEMDKKVSSALVDMYSKGGSVKYANSIFQMISERDPVLYNIMIGGFSYNGHGKEAVRLFEEMLGNRFRPDAVTFIALLSACRHCGLVKEGEKYFNTMIDEYNIIPENDHYACMIDLYGRANRLDKVVAFMKSIPVELDAVILGALLHACRVNGNIALAKEAEEQLLKIEGNNAARYVQLANVYAAGGNWTEMRRIREQMRGKDVKRLAGCSWVYVKNEAHIFISADNSHIKREDIYSILDCIYTELHEIDTACHQEVIY